MFALENDADQADATRSLFPIFVGRYIICYAFRVRKLVWQPVCKGHHAGAVQRQLSDPGHSHLGCSLCVLGARVGEGRLFCLSRPGGNEVRSLAEYGKHLSASKPGSGTRGLEK
eukprot:622690-Rhodomonas_salina.4